MYLIICEEFYNKYFDPEQLEVINGLTCILQTKWDKIYQDVMDVARDYLKNIITKCYKHIMICYLKKLGINMQ